LIHRLFLQKIKSIKANIYFCLQFPYRTKHKLKIDANFIYILLYDIYYLIITVISRRLLCYFYINPYLFFLSHAEKIIALLIVNKIIT